MWTIYHLFTDWIFNSIKYWSGLRIDGGPNLSFVNTQRNYNIFFYLERNFRWDLQLNSPPKDFCMTCQQTKWNSVKIKNPPWIWDGPEFNTWWMTDSKIKIKQSDQIAIYKKKKIDPILFRPHIFSYLREKKSKQLNLKE